MQDPVSEKQSPNKKLVQRVWFWVLIVLVLLLVLFLTLLPVGIDYGIESYLKDQGADQVSLDDVNFNPISGRMTLVNLSVILDTQTVVKIPQAALELEWRPFFSKRFVLKRFNINDAQLTVQAFEDGRWHIGGIELPQKELTSEPSTWNYGLEQLIVKNSIIKFISPRLSVDLKIEQATLSKLSSWLPERKARLELEGQLNDGKLQVQVDVAPFGNDIIADGQIKLVNLSLTPFAQLFKPQINSMEGRLNADLNFETRQAAGTAFDYHQKGTLNLQKIKTRIGDADFAGDGLAWDGTVRFDMPESEKAFKVRADGQLIGSKLSSTHQNETSQIQQDNIDWKGKIDYVQSPAATKVNLIGTLAAHNTNINRPEISLTEERLNWNGILAYGNSGPEAGPIISSDGELSSGSLAVRLPREKINVEKAGLTWQGKFDYAANARRKHINADGQMDLVGIKIKSPEVNFVEAKLTWRGPLELSTATNPENQRIIADGALNSSHLQVNLLNRNLKFEHHGLTWKGRLDSGEANDFFALKTEADIVIDDLQILDAKTNQRLLKSEQIALQAIQAEGLDKIAVSSAALNRLALLTGPEDALSSAADPPPVQVQGVEFNDVRLLQQNSLAIDAIRLNAFKTFLYRNPDGSLAAIDRWHDIQDGEVSANRSDQMVINSKTKEKSGKLGIRIGQIGIAGDSGFRFKDESVNPAFDMDLSILEARLTNLDNRRPDQPSTVKLMVSDTESARLSLEGTLQPFADKLNLNLAGKIESLKLPPLSPYVIQSTGYRFTSGELQADIPLKVVRNELESELDLVLFNPKIKRTKAENTEKQQKGKIQLNTTLPSALKLLRDNQNNVKIKIPINGNINDPQFSITDAINQVLAKTLQKSALSYLKFVLGPYGIGISVAQLAYEQALKIRLNPVQFAPGSDALDEAAIDYLQRVADIMKEYAEVQVVVCGIATESDRAALDASPTAAGGNQLVGQMKNNRDEDSAQKESATPAVTDVTLLELAKNRTQRIKDQLVNRHEIAAKRIIDCNPSIDSNAKAKPRAALEI
jgi:hypothetical protein